ncbi:MAG: serine--tRNA ligase [Bacilli bacterium]|jgi:seryl-tRNA synthetase|nr:serine--tRNA ligase [Erysipelotrichaceae bacterium]OQC50342.1 MAG: Serine--tRNA ligase [Tenericutes bacterium ADurb.Bin024]HOA10884.1 serine--tRNA ligase [Bacilli bacterium]HOE53698.1 serine--tRNA ligase [Bacilli bacterium]HOH94553.1 serine--tRNA ligase [Bacilli bacterium]
MLDINLIRNEAEKVKSLLFKKGWDFDPEPILSRDEKRRKLRVEVEEAKAKLNKLSASVPVVKKAGGDIQAIFAEVKDLKAENEAKEKELKKLDEEVFNLLAELPNLPDEDLLAGGKENNKVVYTFGKMPKFTFPIKDHVELCESLGLIDYKRAAKISGSGTWIYTKAGALLEWGLLNFFVSEHLKAGYDMILPPHLLNYESGFTAGQFPKFKEDVFWLEGTEPRKFLLPTSETALVNFYRDEILKEDELPKKYFAYTPCYRSEAGSYRTEERGMIRGYQFNKVEIFQYTKEQDSSKAFEEMVAHAAGLVEKLGLHFQISKLAAGDCSHSMARTYDIEVYIPSMGIYKEVSSVSNARDYQARRGMARYRDKETNAVKYLHTLNGSGLATSRLIPAIVEQFQQADGTVLVPEVLQAFVGTKVLHPDW